MRQYGETQCTMAGYAIVEAYEEQGGGDLAIAGYAILTDSGVEIATYPTFEHAREALLRSVTHDPNR
jgi:hypothetical protein